MRRSHPSDPLPALSFAILDSADAIILTFEVCANVTAVGFGSSWSWQQLCRIKVGYV